MTQKERVALMVFVTVTLIGLGVLGAGSNWRVPMAQHTVYTEHPNGTQTYVTTGSYVPITYLQNFALWILLAAIIFILDLLILVVE